jgi:recombinational DNA repair protein (RecF pathway)
MANPVPAFKGSSCTACGKPLTEGEDLYLHGDDKLCSECALTEGVVCQCGQYKKPQFKHCYICFKEGKR